MNITEQVAKSLRSAASNREAIAPVRTLIAEGNLAVAYKIQRVNHAIRIAEGDKAVGKKIGLTSKKVQEQLGVGEPDFGVLFHSMEVLDGGTLPWSQTMQPKVEAEIAFVLKKDLDDRNMTIEDIERAVGGVYPAIEIVGSRIKDWDIDILDTVADNASASHFVLGKRKTALSEVDLLECNMELSVNGRSMSSGKGKDSMGSPLIALKWLAQKMVAFGDPLRAGEVILSGALGPMAAVSPGDVVSAEIDGLGNVNINFSK